MPRILNRATTSYYRPAKRKQQRGSPGLFTLASSYRTIGSGNRRHIMSGTATTSNSSTSSSVGNNHSNSMPSEQYSIHNSNSHENSFYNSHIWDTDDDAAGTVPKTASSSSPDDCWGQYVDIAEGWVTSTPTTAATTGRSNH